MPIYEILCNDCGKKSEVLLLGSDDRMVCRECRGENTRKLMSPTSSLTGATPQGHPGPGDTSCCGSRPDQAGCAGPGSCCGRAG